MYRACNNTSEFIEVCTCADYRGVCKECKSDVHICICGNRHRRHKCAFMRWELHYCILQAHPAIQVHPYQELNKPILLTFLSNNNL